MDADVMELPPGFVLDTPAAPPALPDGFVLDKPNMAADVAKSAGIGLAKGAIGLAGLPGDLSDLGARGLTAAMGPINSALGLEAKPQAVNAPPNYSIPGAQAIQGGIENVTGKFYEPQTGAGRIAQTAGEFLPAVIGGPESLAAKLATRVAAPALGSEAAGAATQGTAAEPYARLGGALLGAGGATKAINALNETRAIKAATPTFGDLKKDTSTGYDALTTGNVAIPLPPKSLETLSNDIRDTLNRKGIRPTNASSIHSALDELKTPATAGAPDVADLVASRQSIKGLLGKPDTNKAGAFVALGKIENAIESASPGTMQKLQSLDKDWGAVRSSEALDKKVALAELRASSEHSGFNVGNKIRQQVTNLLASNQAKYLSAETKAELEKITKGTWTSNGIRMVSKLMGGGGGLGMVVGGAAGYQEGGIPGAIATATVGRGLGRLDATLTAKRATDAARAIRAASPTGRAALAQIQAPAALKLTPQQLGILAALSQPTNTSSPLRER